MKTPMQELFEKFGHLLPNIQDEFIEKEKQIIINTFKEAQILHAMENEIRAEQYYNNTFKTNNHVK